MRQCTSGSEPAKLSGPSEVYRSTRNALQRFQEQKVETLFGSLKVERLHDMHFDTRRQAKDEVVDWLTFYNWNRMHFSLGYTSLMAFEDKWRRQQETLAA
jgi:transposase InsO family protein